MCCSASTDNLNKPTLPMQPRSFTIGILLGLSLSLSLTAIGAKPVVPQAVQVAIARLLNGATTEIEVEHGKYEVSTTTTLEVMLDARGGIEEVEVKLPFGLVPAQVVKAARAALPAGAHLAEAELLIRGSALFYEIEARTANGEVELVLDSLGKLVSKHTEQEDEGEEDDDDDK